MHVSRRPPTTRRTVADGSAMPALGRRTWILIAIAVAAILALLAWLGR